MTAKLLLQNNFQKYSIRDSITTPHYVSSFVMLHRITILLLLSLTIISCETKKERAAKNLTQKGVPISATQVITEVENGNRQNLQDLILCEVFPDAVNEKNQSPLQIAVAKGDTTSTELLLKANANPNPPLGTAPITIAAQNDDINNFNLLISYKAKLDAKMPDGELLLPWTVLHKKIGMAEALVKAGANSNQTNLQGQSILQMAVAQKYSTLITCLLQAGANVDTPTLHRAIFNGLWDSVPLLVEKGADPYSPVTNHTAAVDLILDAKQIPLFQKILELKPLANFSSLDPKLWHAWQTNNTAALDALLVAGAPAALLDGGQRTLIHACIANGDLTTAEKLLKLKKPSGAAMLHALSKNNLPSVKLLMQYGATVHDPNTNDTALAAAIRYNATDVFHYLLENDSSQALTDSPIEKQSLLACAIAVKNIKIVQTLIARGANVNQKLHTPANAAFLKLISGKGMKWYLTNDRNVTPLMLAADSGDIEITRTLLKNNAIIDCWTAVAKTWPLNFASRKSDVKMMRLLLGRDPENEDRKIIVDISSQRATVTDGQGKTILSTRVSTGKTGHATPTGVFVITNKHKDWNSTIYDAASMPYFQRLSCGDFGLHQGIVPKYPASHGCIRVPAGTAYKLFQITQTGDRVTIQQ